MDVYKDNILDGMIVTFHFQRSPAAAAHLMLTQMIGSEVCTLQYVEGLYKRIEDKKFSLKKPQLLDFPDHVLENIAKELDVESRSIVRKSCKTLRAIVDRTPLRLESLRIHFDFNSRNWREYISLDAADLAVKYYKKEGGCLIKSSDGRERFVNGKMRQLVIDDLKTIFLNPKLKIECLEITKPVVDRYQPMFKEFAQLLSSLGHNVHVERFSWELNYNPEELMQIFNAMKPSTLESITLHICYVAGYENIWAQLYEEFFNLPQWKEAKKLVCTCKIDPKNFIHLAEFNKVFLRRETFLEDAKITGEIIMAMKNKLLENEDFEDILIYDEPTSIPIKVLKALLLRFQSPADPRWAQFNYPNSNKKLLIRIYSDHIWFKGPCSVHDGDESEDESEDEEISDEEGEESSDSSDEEPEE